MLVTIKNYKEGARVKFTPSSYKHYLIDHHFSAFEELYTREYNLPRLEEVKEFKVSKRPEERSYWVPLFGSSDVTGGCISEFTHVNSPGYFLEYVELYNIENIISDLEKLEERI